MGFARGLANGEAVPAAAAVGIAGIALILALERWLPKLPAVLIAVVLSIAATEVSTVSTSASRTAVAERSGAKTQLTGVIGAALITLMIVFVPGLFRNQPQPALAAVLITAALSLADVPGVVRLWRQRKAECLLSVAAFLGVVLLGVLPGIAITVGMSIPYIFRRAWMPYRTVLGRVKALPAAGPRRPAA